MAELIELHPLDPEQRKLARAVECLKSGGLIVFPTDSVYAFGCALNHPKAIEKMAKIKGVKREKANFSIVCQDLAQVARYTKQIDTPSYKLMKRATPGPFTFILEASADVPAFFKTKRRHIGIRIPQRPAAQQLVGSLGIPMVCSSVHDDDAILEHIADPELILEKHGHEVDIIIADGPGQLTGSTVVDLTGPQPEVVREGLGSLDLMN